jgi:Rps23 Pro-64 3,4-dihydroxylase Tpa1-like proline 4-hydroxylase
VPSLSFQANEDSMELIFEDLISSFIETNIGISNHFLSLELANHLKQNLVVLHNNKLLLAAGTGNAEKLSYNNAVRSDAIYWLDKNHQNPFENEFLLQIEEFIKYLNMSCYAGITDYEFHYSYFEIGSFFLKHLDQFKNNSSRKYSLISYLNNDWQALDGGELLIHQSPKNQIITPTQGKTVLFKSNELFHEVLVTNKIRMSVTGWLKGS